LTRRQSTGEHLLEIFKVSFAFVYACQLKVFVYRFNGGSGFPAAIFTIGVKTLAAGKPLPQSIGDIYAADRSVWIVLEAGNITLWVV
jgi:hypothetical protein